MKAKVVQGILNGQCKIYFDNGELLGVYQDAKGTIPLTDYLIEYILYTFGDILVLFIKIDLVIFAGIIIEIILGFFGNYLYFLQVKKDILAGTLF